MLNCAPWIILWMPYAPFRNPADVYLVWIAKETARLVKFEWDANLQSYQRLPRGCATELTSVNKRVTCRFRRQLSAAFSKRSQDKGENIASVKSIHKCDRFLCTCRLLGIRSTCLVLNLTLGRFKGFQDWSCWQLHLSLRLSADLVMAHRWMVRLARFHYQLAARLHDVPWNTHVRRVRHVLALMAIQNVCDTQARIGHWRCPSISRWHE